MNYTIKYGNEEDQVVAPEVTITDTLPDVEFVGASPYPSTFQGNIMFWKIGDLAPQQSGTIYLTVHIRSVRI